MSRCVEIAGAALGAAAGACVHGTAGVAGGAMLGLVFALLGRRSDDGRRLTARQRREMESAAHVGIAASWALRPIAAEGLGAEIERIATYLKETLVEPYVAEVTPAHHLMRSLIVAQMESGIPPYASMRHVRRRFGPRAFRRNTTVLDRMLQSILEINADYGNFVESRDWFDRWCREMGLGDRGAPLWEQYFGEKPEVTLRQRRAAAAPTPEQMAEFERMYGDAA